jgi:ubiquinol-cytochrome c reductase iron-sulfur subunit
VDHVPTQAGIEVMSAKSEDMREHEERVYVPDESRLPEEGRLPDVVADPVADPGVPEEHHRLTDIDPRAEKRAERQVAGLFGFASIMVVAFIAAFVIFGITPDDDGLVDVGDVQISNLTLGLTLGLALFCIGAAAIHWSRTIMTSPEIVSERHPLRSDDDTRAAVVNDFNDGVEETGFGRRTLIRNSMLGALALLPLPAVVLLRDLGPLPGDTKEHTIWDADVRVLTDVSFQPLRPEDLELGSLVNAMPETFEDLPDHGPERINARGKVPVILIRMDPADLKNDDRSDWHVDGILAFSKICTHVGCPISLYEQTTHHLLCPCHQSTFDLSDNGRVVFGPANRALPQLPLKVTEDGYLAAQSDFNEPVGPSYWERG